MLDLIDWNLRFRYDRRWRIKHNIAFNSKAHRESNQIDIWFEMREDRLFEKLEKEYVEQQIEQAELKKKGKMVKERILSSVHQDRLFGQLREQIKASNKKKKNDGL